MNCGAKFSHKLSNYYKSRDCGNPGCNAKNVLHTADSPYFQDETDRFPDQRLCESCREDIHPEEVCLERSVKRESVCALCRTGQLLFNIDEFNSHMDQMHPDKSLETRRPFRVVVIRDVKLSTYMQTDPYLKFNVFSSRTQPNAEYARIDPCELPMQMPDWAQYLQPAISTVAPMDMSMPSISVSRVIEPARYSTPGDIEQPESGGGTIDSAVAVFEEQRSDQDMEQLHSEPSRDAVSQCGSSGRQRLRTYSQREFGTPPEEEDNDSPEHSEDMHRHKRR